MRKTMPLIVLKGLRGGVGTTSIAVALARQFHHHKYNVIVIDNCVDNILHFYFPEKPQGTTLGQALLAHTPIEQAIYHYQNGYQILPFGVVNSEDKLHLQASATANQHLQHFFTAFTQQYPDTLIFLDLQPEHDTLFKSWIAKANIMLTVTTPESNCHIRLNQHTFAANEYILVNQFCATSQIHQDFYQFWQASQFPFCPIKLHRDEALLEACASRLPLYDYRANCMLVEEINQLLQWCLPLLLSKKG